MGVGGEVKGIRGYDFITLCDMSILIILGNTPFSKLDSLEHNGIPMLKIYLSGSGLRVIILTIIVW